MAVVSNRGPCPREVSIERSTAAVKRYRRHPILYRDLYLLEVVKHFAPP
jgi:hypothetical protein